ncbi:MAG: sugar ABC transporter substrate-binding protein [Oscillospiraceae bacterium]|nr:sugar ABC transporter substrate-binding protein [Oscillospiraceae bacterium]MCL2278387.1 sugar ABC transporter substrate-binding protein [Oscillospiraceae bacterium]
MKKKVLAAFLVLLLLATPVALVACGNGDGGTAQTPAQGDEPAANGGGDAPIRIGISMESLESQFLVMNHQAMLEQAEAMGAEAIVLIAEGDATRQNQQIENLLAQGVDAIIAFPNDGAAIASAVRMAQDQGVPFIMNNRAIQSDDVVPELQVLSNNEQMAYDVVTWFGERARAEGNSYQAILLVGSLADQGAVYRQIGHLRAIEAFSDVIELVAEIPTEWNHDMALSGLQSALQANPGANLIITPSDFLLPPIRSALEQFGKWAQTGDANHVSLITFDGDEVGMQYLVDGFSTANAAQDPVFTGRTCVEWAVRIVRGETPPSLIIYDPGIIATEDNLETVGPTVWS